MNVSPADTPSVPAAPSIEEVQLKGISRTVAEIHWLLLILVLLFIVFGEYDKDSEPAISAGAFFYAAFVMSFRYAFFFTRESRAKIAVETWAMVAFITWTLAFTGGLASPLLNTYLLPIITSALTLGKVATLFEVGMVCACHIWLGGNVSAGALISLSFIGALAAQMAPVLLVAYIVTMFSSDIHFGLNRVRMLAETDDLTGVLNTRGFAIAATRLFGQGVRYQRPTSILMIDSDDLKAVNDNHGHDAGNRLLRQLARVVQGELRATDVLARYGGDEFIVLLPETPSDGAVAVAERICEMMASVPIEAQGKQVRCTVSIGAASFPEDGVSLDAVVARADRAMYEAKTTGRNKVVRFAEIRTAPRSTT
jgi:diguanylate cyclase (GGDEF)-like protein